MRRTLLLISALLSLAVMAPAGSARAQSSAPPCPNPRPAPVWTSLQPPVPCAGRPVGLLLHYFGCCTSIAAIDTPTVAHGWIVHLVNFSDSCAALPCASDSVAIPLGLLAAGHYEVQVHFVTEWQSQVETCATEEDRRIAFDVAASCSPQAIPYLDHVEIGHAGVACPGDSIPVRFTGTLPNNCMAFAGVEIVPSPIVSPTPPFALPPTLRLVFTTNSALGMPCIETPVPWSAALRITPLIPNNWRLPVEALLIDLGPQPPDSTNLGHASFPFTVLDSCTTNPPIGCMLPSWTHPNPGDCDAFIAPDHDAQLTLEIGTDVPLAALQGTVLMSPLGLHITDAEPVGPAAGMHLSWNLTPDGMKFVLLATEGAPIPGGTLPGHVPVLRLTFAPDAVAPTAPRTRVFVGNLLGADASGQAVYYCPTFAPVNASAWICRGMACDFNRDGQVDVRDLVRMVRCVNRVDTCDAAYTAMFDCNGDQTFDLDDVLCCALAILGQSPAPGGGQERQASLRVAMDSPMHMNDAIEIPMEISGDAPLGAARLSLSLPTQEFGSISVKAEPGTPWLALRQVDPGYVTIGLITTQPGAPSNGPVRFTLRLEPLADTAPHGEVALVGSDFAATDGVRLISDPGSPIAVLGSGGRPRLGPGHPNPFGGTQRISLVLPRRASVDLAIYDLSGRRLRTLQRGTLDSGGHDFTWDGRDDAGRRLPGGVYFYRARVDGVATAQRVVLLGAPR